MSSADSDRGQATISRMGEDRTMTDSLSLTEGRHDPTPAVDIVLVGVTGFVGRLTAEYLARNAREGVRVALAGRSSSKVAEVRATLPGAAHEWPIITLDLTDEDQVDQVVASTRVVISTAGPYLRVGLPLVRACARAGVHYTDLTGEVLFVYRSIEQADSDARRTGARIVHSCGFDSIPSDLGMWLTAAQSRADGQGGITAAQLHVRAVKGGLSGGTVDSMRQLFIEAAGSAGARRILADPHALTDTPGPRSNDVSAPLDPQAWRLPGGIRRSGSTGTWSAPFVMAGINTATVQRSNALLTARGAESAYGLDLRYHEVMDTGRGLRGALNASGITAGIGLVGAGLSFGPTRAVLDRVLPKPGDGPSADAMASGLFKVRIEARTETGARYETDVAADLDPGYRGTAVMLAQSALALAAGEGDDTTGGVLTPAAAFGGVLVDRLRDADFTLTSTQVRGATGGNSSAGSDARG